MLVKLGEEDGSAGSEVIRETCHSLLFLRGEMNPSERFGRCRCPSALPMSRAKLLQLHIEQIELGDGRSVILQAALGKGSCATVYRALLCSANGLRRAVALKLFSTISSDEADQVLTQLARTASRVALSLIHIFRHVS